MRSPRLVAFRYVAAAATRSQSIRLGPSSGDPDNSEQGHATAGSRPPHAACYPRPDAGSRPFSHRTSGRGRLPRLSYPAPMPHRTADPVRSLSGCRHRSVAVGGTSSAPGRDRHGERSGVKMSLMQGAYRPGIPAPGFAANNARRSCRVAPDTMPAARLSCVVFVTGSDPSCPCPCGGRIRAEPPV